MSTTVLPRMQVFLVSAFFLFIRSLWAIVLLQLALCCSIVQALPECPLGFGVVSSAPV
jgi:hypothetical protein